MCVGLVLVLRVNVVFVIYLSGCVPIIIFTCAFAGGIFACLCGFVFFLAFSYCRGNFDFALCAAAAGVRSFSTVRGAVVCITCDARSARFSCVCVGFGRPGCGRAMRFARNSV